MIRIPASTIPTRGLETRGDHVLVVRPRREGRVQVCIEQRTGRVEARQGAEQLALRAVHGVAGPGGGDVTGELAVDGGRVDVVGGLAPRDRNG